LIKKLKKDAEEAKSMFEKRVLEERAKIMKEVEDENKKEIGKKEERIKLLSQKNSELQTRIDMVQTDYKSLEDDFREFKRAKNEQDIEARSQIDRLTD